MLILCLLISSAFLSIPAKAVNQNLAPGIAKNFTRDTSGTALPATFAANAVLASGLSHVSGFSIINESATDIQCNTVSTATNCAGAAEGFTVPNKGYVSLPRGEVSINTQICCHGYGGTVASGLIHVSVW